MLRGCNLGIPTPGCDDKALEGQGTAGDRRLIMPFSELVAIALSQGHPIRLKILGPQRDPSKNEPPPKLRGG